MLTSIPVRRSERSKNVQTTTLDDSSIIEQNMPVRRNPSRPEKLIPEEINFQQELSNDVPIETRYTFNKPTDMLVRRKRGRPRKSVPTEINCQGELLNTKPKCRKPRRPRKFIPKDMKGQECALSSFNREGNCNKKGKYAQVNYQIEGAGEPSILVKENDNVWAGEVNHPIWSGSISISHENFGVVDGLEAYMSSRASVEVVDAVQQLPALLNAQVLSRLDVWPTHGSSPTDDIIDFCIVPANERSEDVFYSLLDAITREDVVLKAVYADVSILIFSSLQLTYPCWTATFGKFYLWAVFEGKNSFFLTNEVQPVTQNEDHDIRRSGNPEKESCSRIAHAIRPEFGTMTETTSIHEHLIANHRESPSAVRNVPADSESIATTVLEMAKNFNDQTYTEEISSPYAVEPKYARTLGAILDKHGDITRDCVIKCTKTLTCALERLCASVQDLENLRFADLHRSHLMSMESAISDAEVMELDVKWFRKRYEELKEAIARLPEYKNLKDKRKEVQECGESKKKVITWKKNEILKLEADIEKLESEVAEFTQEKEKLSSEISRFKSLLSQISLTEGLV